MIQSLLMGSLFLLLNIHTVYKYESPLFLCVCVQDGGRALEEAMCYNTSVTQLDIRLTGADEQSTSFILQALLANEGLDDQKNAEKCEMEGHIDKNIADLLENMTVQE